MGIVGQISWRLDPGSASGEYLSRIAEPSSKEWSGWGICMMIFITWMRELPGNRSRKGQQYNWEGKRIRVKKSWSARKRWILCLSINTPLISAIYLDNSYSAEVAGQESTQKADPAFHGLGFFSIGQKTFPIGFTNGIDGRRSWYGSVLRCQFYRGPR